MLTCNPLSPPNDISPHPFPSPRLVLGILELYTSGVPSGDFFVGLAAHIGVTYAAISIGLNVLVSAMICARIAYLGVAMHSTRHTTRGKEMMRYAGTIPIIVESALPYAVAGIAFLVSYGMGSGISIFFMSIYVMFTVSLALASLLYVIFRACRHD